MTKFGPPPRNSNTLHYYYVLINPGVTKAAVSECVLVVMEQCNDPHDEGVTAFLDTLDDVLVGRSGDVLTVDLGEKTADKTRSYASPPVANQL